MYLKYHGQPDIKQNMIIATYKELLGTGIKSKKQHIYYHVKILQSNCFANCYFSAYQGSLFLHVWLRDPPTGMSKN